MTLVAAALIASLGFGAQRVRQDFVCDGCTLVSSGPDNDILPLVVVLHGDEGSVRKVAPLWTPLAENGICRGDANAAPASRTPHVCPSLLSPDEERRPLRVFAPRCPRSEGCTGSWWRWLGDASWMAERIREVGALVGVDPERVYLAGWSGGASYLSMSAADWFPQAAALSLAGGGAPPRGACLPQAGKSCAAIHHLMGDQNPLFDLAVSTRDALVACGHDVTWQLVPGADHAGEWRAYGAQLATIAWWLLDHRAGCASAVQPPLPGPEASSASTQRAPDPAPTSSAPIPSSHPPSVPSTLPPPRSGCSSCEASPSASTPAFAGLLGLLSARGRRSGRRGSRARL